MNLGFKKENSPRKETSHQKLVPSKVPSELSDTYRAHIISNIQKLILNCKYSQNQLAHYYGKAGLDISQGTISKYMSKKDDLSIQFSFIVLTCKLFNIPIYELADENFDYTLYLTVDLDDSIKKLQTPSAFKLPDLGNKFITDPNDDQFTGYLQTYYCYFMPTLSGENKILEGILELIPNGTCCSAKFTLNTNKVKNGIPIQKVYTGYALISTAVESLYIFLSSPIEGEISVINLRHFFIRHEQLDCRMAEVITNGAGERHFPTIHRMLLSRQQITNAEHWEYLTPHLHLNSNTILVPKKGLEQLKETSPEYNTLIQLLTNFISPTEFYSFKENFVVTNAEQLLPKNEVQQFLCQLRKNSTNMRYNKVSNKLDERIRNTLLSLGYYKDTSPEK